MPGSRTPGFQPANLAAAPSGLGPASHANSSRTIALSVEFVAKPEKAKSAPAFLPKALQGALKEVAGFAGCVVMSANQEARLITVITFWKGNDCHKRCAENVRWVRALLAGYVDHCLRVQTLLAHTPVTQEPAAKTDGGETSDAEMGLMLEEPALAEETVCVA
jgi:hypothetical protein